MSAQQIAAFEELIGGFLLDLGYSLGAESKPGASLRATRLRTTYRAMFAAKHWLKSTPLGRLVRLERIEIEPKTK